MAFGSVFLVAGTASAAPGSHTREASHALRRAIPGFRPGGPLLRPGGADRKASRRNGLATVGSTNWSGYAATGADGSFSSVSASWTEPAAACTPPGIGGRGSDSAVAFWAGLDGYSSATVEQTGTVADCSGRTAQYAGWYEMYPAYPVYFANTVLPGDWMIASVKFSGTDTYTLVLKDATQGWTQTVVQHEAGLDRSSAEVITEAPGSGGGIVPLADFGTVGYSMSTVNGTPLRTQRPVQILMVNNSGMVKATTSWISVTGTFTNTWRLAS
jgi:hypothetical protein